MRKILRRKNVEFWKDGVMAVEWLGIKGDYIKRLRDLKMETLKTRLLDVEWHIRNKSAYAIMPWEEVKEEIEAEMATRLGVEAGREVCGLIWDLRDGNASR